MLANINNTETLISCLFTPGLEIISYNDLVGTLYLKPSQEAGCIDVYDRDGDYLFTDQIDDVDLEGLKAKFDHRSEYMTENTWESHYYGLAKEEYEQTCLDEYLSIWEYVDEEKYRSFMELEDC